MSSTYGENLKLSIFGQSHGAAIGMTLDGIPAGQKVDTDALQLFLNRRAPGQNDLSTPRKEADRPEFLSGILDGYTCGAPIAAIIRNSNTRSGDYSNLANNPRPGHADYTAHVKYGGFQDAAGGGHFSGRLTAPLCIAGGMCLQWLVEEGIYIGAHIQRIGNTEDSLFSPLAPEINQINPAFPVLNSDCAAAMAEEIRLAKADGDSIGGIIECAVVGLKPGLGEPMFGGVESKLAQILYGIPAAKALEFGAGFDLAKMRGSQSNDPFCYEDGTVKTITNNCGGILGGITDGMPVIFRLAIKPTPSISKPQQSVDLLQKACSELIVHGRHDPCIVHRAVPVVEAATAIAIYDMLLGNSQTDRRK